MRLPQTVGEYRLLERIGGGAFGTVYRAEIEGELGYKQECALKLLDPGRAAAEPEEVAALADEARILSRLHHPAIVHVRRFTALSHEFFGDTWGLEMELVRGVTLDRVIAVQDRLSVPAVVSILAELLEGLHYAHGAKGQNGEFLGLVHRDLKPENIVVTFEGRLKLLDFGIARAEGRIGHDTAVGETKGTPLYMSPEQLRGETLTGASDLYAVGALAFELLTPERYVHLEDVPDVQAVLIAVSETRFEDRRELLEESLAAKPILSSDRAAEIVAWVESLLHHEEVDRVASASDALDALTSIAGLYKPHRSRDLLRKLVEELAEAPPEIPAPRGAPIRSNGPTQLVPSSGPREDSGDSSDWLVGPTPLRDVVDLDDAPAEDFPEASRSGWVVAGLVLVLGVGLALTALQMWNGGDDTPSDLPVVVSSGIASTVPAPDAIPAAEGEAVTDAEPADAEATPDEPEAEPADDVAEPAPTPAPKASPTPATWSPPVAVAEAPVAQASLEHTPPKVAVAGSPLKFRAKVVGDCTPELHWGAMEGPQGASSTFTSSGDGVWTTTIRIPYDARHASGVRYYLECCTSTGACPASFRSASSPQVVPAPAF